MYSTLHRKNIPTSMELGHVMLLMIIFKDFPPLQPRFDHRSRHVGFFFLWTKPKWGSFCQSVLYSLSDI
jgi:hypothetical protein